MLKSIILFGFILYCVFVVSGWVLRTLGRVMGGGRPTQPNARQQRTYRRAYGPRRAAQRPEGDLRIDHVPEPTTPNERRHDPDRYRGGEYVDYEEV
ncbi:MAG: DUF4834 family protein [Catalinimonas sp.]